MAKKSKSDLSSLWGVVLLLVLVALFYWYNPEPAGKEKPFEDGVPTITITDSDMALALLPEVSVSEVVGRTLKSALVQFNDHLEPTSGYEYTSYLGQSYSDSEHREVVSIALARYESNEAAKVGMEFKAANDPRLATPKSSMQYFFAHYTPQTADMPDSVSVRIVYENFSAKLQIFDVENKVSSEKDADILMEQAFNLALAQNMNLERLVKGEFSYEKAEKNEAMKRLPMTLSGATYIGSTGVTKSQWISLTREDEAKLVGFKSGGLSRFKLDARPDEVVEVVVMEFDKNENALAYRNSLTVGGAFAEENGQVITLQGEMAKDAIAMMTDFVTELEFVRGPYLIDISIFSPFAERNEEAAKVDIVTFGQQLTDWFKE